MHNYLKVKFNIGIFSGIIVFLDAISSPALAFNVFLGDTNPNDARTSFEESFDTNSSSSVIDDGTSAGFGGIAPAVNSSVPSVIRTGTLDGSSFDYTIYDIDFSTSPNGNITPGAIGDDINDLDNLNIEQKAEQDGVTGTYTWGVDSLTGQNSNPNAILLDFSSSIGHFGIDLHDFEAGLEDASSGASGEIRIYQNQTLIQSITLQFPGPATGTNNSMIAGFGNRESKFVGIVANDPSQFFDQIAFVVGDDDIGDNGYSERWAADGFTFGTAYQSVPFDFHPFPGLFLVGSFWGINKLRKKRNKRNYRI